MYGFNTPTLKRVLPLAVMTAGLVYTPASSAIEEIIVTAQKREENVQDVPVSVTALSGTKLEELNITDVFDLQQSAPGLTVKQNQVATTTNFSIRGIGTSGSNFGLESSVGLYVDGVYRARQSSMINEMVDMQRVEVLRGPQGTLFGRNSPSGAVLFYTKAPDPEFGGYIDMDAGNYNLYSVNGAVGGSLIDDVLAYRITGFTTQRDGYIDDLFLGDNVLNDRDRQGFRGQLLYTPSEDFSARLIVDYSTIDEKCCAAVTVMNNFFSAASGPGTDFFFAFPSSLLIPGLPIPGFGATIVDESRVFDDVVAYNLVPQSESEDRGISAELNWDTWGGTITSITAFRRYDSDDLVDADFSTVRLANRDEHAEQKSFSQELRFSSDFENGNYVVGAYYFQQQLNTLSNFVMDADFNNFAALGVFQQASELATAGQLLQAQYAAETATAIVFGLENVPLTAGNPLLALQGLGFMGVGFPTGSLARNSMKQDHDAWALFGQVNYNLTPAWRLTLGARYTNETKKLDGKFTEPGGSWGLLLNDPRLTVFNPRPNIDETLDDDQISGNIKLSWFSSEDIMFYVSYATGYKSGGTNTDRINPAFSPIFDAETSEAIELGMKADFPKQNLRTNLAIHDTTTRDYQTNSFQGAGFNLLNAGEVETKGLELEMWWQPDETLDVNFAYVYNEGEFKDFQGNCWIAYTWHTGIDDPGRYTPDIFVCDRSGDPLDSNPENQYFVGVTKRIPIGDTMMLSLHADYNFQDEQYRDGNIDPLKKTESYDLLNARVGVNFNDMDLELSVWARNLLDEDYLQTFFDTPLQDGKLSAYPTEPRTYGISLTKHF